MSLWNCNGHLLSGLGISPGHTAYGDSQGIIDGWAQGKSIGSFDQYSYTRPDGKSINAYAPGSVHVNLPYDESTKVDYVMFKNTDIDPGRWFYGAVTYREYVNPSSTRLWFTLDYWLTYNDELRNGIGACLIERSHVKLSEDWNGNYPSFSNLNPESFVPMPQQKYYDEWNKNSESQWTNLVPTSFIVYAATDEKGKGDYTVKTISGVPTACYTKTCANSGELSALIKEYNDAWVVPFVDTSNPDSIIAVTYVPSELTNSVLTPLHTWETDIPNKGNTLRKDGKPFNNAKCFTYPYMWASAKVASGQELAIKFEEYSINGKILHSLQGGGGLQSKYKYCINNFQNNMKFLMLPEYPQIPVRSDTFSQWVASNALGSIVGVALATSMVGVGIASLPIAGASLAGIGGISGFSNITLGGSILTDRLNSINQNAHMADTMVGSATSMDAVAFNLYRVSFYINMPSIDDLTSVDDYFNAFGYSVMKYDIPNLKVRQFYTYVKTSNANVRASVPIEGINQICSMLNKGTTFWNISAGDIGVKREVNPDA